LSREGGGAAAIAAAARGALGALQQLAAALAESVLFPMNYLALLAKRHSLIPLADLSNVFLTHSPGKEKHNQRRAVATPSANYAIIYSNYT
jgi:hypothetical protein